MSTTAGPAEPPLHRGLKSSVLSPLEVLGQSIANIAPTATPSVVIPLVFVAAGAGAWAAYLFAVLAIALVAININQFARRSASPGNLYSYIASSLGPLAAITIGWALFVAYVGTASSVTTGFANYVNVLLIDIHVTAHGLGTAALTLVVLASVVLAWYIAYRDVKLSARLMLILETVSVALIGVVVIVTLISHPLNSGVLSLKGVRLNGLRTGLVLAIFSFVGFESATSLGTEAKRPLTTIPRAVLRSALFVGAFFVISAYAETVGFAAHHRSLGASAAPVQDLAHFASLSWLSVPLTAVAAISFFACTLASITAGARVLYQVGRHGVFGGWLAEVHESNRTPHVAISFAAIVAAIPAAALTLEGSGLFTIYGWVGTTATLSFIVAYTTVSVAAPLYLYRRHELRVHHVAIAIVAVIFQLIALEGSVLPLPTGAALWPVVAFFAFLLVGIVHGALVVRHNPKVRAAVAGGLIGDALIGDALATGSLAGAKANV